MNSFLRKGFVLGTAIFLALGVAGCKEEGALEKAGKEADKAMEKTSDAAKDAVNKAKEELE